MSADPNTKSPAAQPPDELAGDELATAARGVIAELKARADERRGVHRAGERRSLPNAAAQPADRRPSPPAAGPIVNGRAQAAAERLERRQAAHRTAHGFPAERAPFAGRPAPQPTDPSRRPPHRTRSRAQRLEAAKRKEERHAVRVLERWRARARERGGHGVAITIVPRHVYETTWAIVADPSGAALRAALRSCPNSAAKAAMLRAALGVTREGFARYRFNSLRSRRIAALGVGLLLMATRTRRRGAWGGGVVKGVPRGALCELLRDVNDPRPRDSRGRCPGVPSVTALFGHHRTGATVDSGEVGYWCALRENGFGYRLQPRRDVADPCESAFGPYCTNQYWVCASAVERCADRFRAELEQRIALLVALQAAPAELEAELGRLHTERPPPD